MLYEHADMMVQEGMIRVVYQMKADIPISPMTWGCITCRARRTMRQGMAVPCVATYLPFFWNVTGEYPVSRGRVAWRFGDRNKSHPSFVGKLRHFFEKRRSPSPSWWSSWGFWSSNDFTACHRAQADLFQNWLRWLKSFTEVKTILVAQNQGASVKPCGVPYELYYSYIIYIYIHITFALIYQWLAFYIAFFFVRFKWLWMIKDHVKTQLKTKPLPGFTFWAFWTIVSSPRGVCICSAQEQVLADLPPKTEATRNAYFELAKTEFENWGYFFWIYN